MSEFFPSIEDANDIVSHLNGEIYEFMNNSDHRIPDWESWSFFELDSNGDNFGIKFMGLCFWDNDNDERPRIGGDYEEDPIPLIDHCVNYANAVLSGLTGLRLETVGKEKEEVKS